MPDPTSGLQASISPAPIGQTQPTRTRYWVLVFAVTLAIIQYIDRVCIAQAAPFIKSDLGLDDAKMGWVFGAFTLAYSLFEVPAGYLGDRIGPRKVLLRIVLWWSFFTALTGWVRSWFTLTITRFLFGAGEAGAFPNLTKALNRWMPAKEWTRAQGIMWMSAFLAGTPLFVGALGSLFAGWLSPILSQRWGMATVRRGMGAVGAAGAACLLVISTWLTNPFLAVAAIALVSFCNDIQLPGAWT